MECLDKSNRSFCVGVKKEVLVSSGAFGSPQILMRSGIGPTEELKTHGIDTLFNIPGVGKIYKTILIM